MFTPLADNVLIKRIEAVTTTKGGLIIPDSSVERPQSGTVYAVGQGRYDLNGNLVPMHVKVGQVVMFAKHNGIEIKVDDEGFVVMREGEILGIL